MFTLPTIDTIGTGMRIKDLRKMAGLSVKDMQDIHQKTEGSVKQPTLEELIEIIRM